MAGAQTVAIQLTLQGLLDPIGWTMTSFDATTENILIGLVKKLTPPDAQQRQNALNQLLNIIRPRGVNLASWRIEGESIVVGLSTPRPD